MNLYIVSYSTEAPKGLAESVVAARYVRTRTETGETIEFRVDRPAGSSSQFDSIAVLSVPANWVSDIQDFGDVSRLSPGP